MIHGESDPEYQDEDFMKSPPLNKLEYNEKTAEKHQDRMFDNLDDFFDQ
ncbi:hypothetical protein [Halalkalicoccus ordinarius]